MNDDNKKTQIHTPRPIRPEDESYRDLMMRFTAHPVKPKYWFEEFGSHWSCSCGQINKGERCSNCGLERDLLRKLFFVHKPGSEESDPDTKEDLSNGLTAISDSQPEGPAPPAPPAPKKKRSRPLVIGIIAILVLLLAGTAAYLYYVAVPEMEAEDKAVASALVDTMSKELPKDLQGIISTQYAAYVNAGDSLCDGGHYHTSLTYYNKAAALKDDESIQQKIQDAKFGYVQAHRKKGKGKHYKEYIDELYEAEYNGIQEVYREYYAWKVKIRANNIPDDYDTDMKTVTLHDTIYFHVKLSGGPPGGKVRLFYKVTWPSGASETRNLDSSWKKGSKFTSRFQYPMPLFGKEGKLKFQIYDADSHDLLKTDSITLKK